MYSLNCNYYAKEFPTLEALIDDVMASGMDPCYEVTRDGVGIQEELIHFIQLDEVLKKIHLNNLKAMTLLSMFHELNSFVACAQHFEAASQSGITASNNKNFAGLVKEWGRGDYDECPELLVQQLTSLL